VTVVRGRAEEVMGKLPQVHVVTARAVAPLDRLAMTAALTLASDDAREGYTAKAERRPPRFTGG
ncbi:hypothetical protein ACFCYA_23075, partial [Streptomyces virginiae]